MQAMSLSYIYKNFLIHQYQITIKFQQLMIDTDGLEESSN